jgi:hypothetical protein
MAVAAFLAKMAEDPDLDAEDHEAFARNSVRAAYYACYHYALEWAELRGYKWPEGWSSHDGLWGCWFAREPETDDIRQVGQALMAKRHQADYKTGVAFVHDVNAVLEEADEFWELIQADMERVANLPPQERRVAWTKKGHPNPKNRRRPKKPKPSLAK